MGPLSVWSLHRKVGESRCKSIINNKTRVKSMLRVLTTVNLPLPSVLWPRLRGFPLAPHFPPASQRCARGRLVCLPPSLSEWAWV